jgi:hypothetical protein
MLHRNSYKKESVEEKMRLYKREDRQEGVIIQGLHCILLKISHGGILQGDLG